jgi:murein DD-endopeptidase MepM/ murein hydrolase activator NlpD
MKSLIASLVVLVATSVASAEPTVSVTPAKVHPGEPALVTVTGVDAAPHGKAGGQPLMFFRAERGYQAVFATSLGVDEDHVLVEVTGGAKPITVAIANKKFPETAIAVEDDYANPSKQERDTIDSDNRAIGDAYAGAKGPPQFTRAFRRPPGKLTSPFGEWRTFNDSHRAQHLGIDLAAREGAKVAAINDGTVVLVRDTFLAGTVVVVAHGAGISSLYFHLSKATVAEGDSVKQGQEIGRAGHTGRTTGPHLHLSVHVANGMVDPIAFFALPLEPARPVAQR